MAINVGESATTSETAGTGSGRAWLVGLLLLGGVLLVTASQPLGQWMVENCDSSGHCGWAPEEVDRAALVLRSLGAMAFAAGLVERVVLALRRGTA